MSDTPTNKEIWDYIRQAGALDRHGYGLAYVESKIVRISCGRCVHGRTCREVKIPCGKWKYKEEDKI
jgi:hypothetical protein